MGKSGTDRLGHQHCATRFTSLSRFESIAQEQLDGQLLDAYVSLVRHCSCNMRKVLQRIESGDMLV